MENDPIPFVKPNHSLLIQIKRDKIVGILVLKIRAIKNYESKKECLEFLKYICLIVENLLNGRKYRDKLLPKDLITLAFEIVFQNTFNKEKLLNDVQFLYDNEQIIPSSILNKIYGTVEHWLVRKKKRLSA